MLLDKALFQRGLGLRLYELHQATLSSLRNVTALNFARLALPGHTYAHRKRAPSFCPPVNVSATVKLDKIETRRNKHHN